MGFGQAVRELRRSRDLTQVQLAEMTGLTQRAISKIEQNSCSGLLSSAVKISRALGIPLDLMVAGIA